MTIMYVKQENVSPIWQLTTIILAYMMKMIVLYYIHDSKTFTMCLLFV